MLYKRLIINGKEYLLAVSQAGSGAPEAATPGSLGIQYMDTDTGDLYKCTGGEDGAWEWKRLGEGGSDYKLPVGGDQLGGVKNGGNVVINPDGTMTVRDSSQNGNVGSPTDEQVESAVEKYLEENPIEGGGAVSITVDSTLSKTSENPVQNKVIATEIENLKKIIKELKESLKTWGNIVVSETIVSVDEGSTATFTVSLDVKPDENQTVEITSTGDYITVSPSTLTFTPDNYNVAQTVTVTADEDTEEGEKQSTITLSSVDKTIQISVKVVDNDVEIEWHTITSDEVTGINSTNYSLATYTGSEANVLVPSTLNDKTVQMNAQLNASFDTNGVIKNLKFENGVVGTFSQRGTNLPLVERILDIPNLQNFGLGGSSTLKRLTIQENNTNCTSFDVKTNTALEEISGLENLLSIESMEQSMSSCNSLVSVDSLPPNLKNSRLMFWKCAALKDAPVIDVELTSWSQMFLDCTALTEVVITAMTGCGVDLIGYNVSNGTGWTGGDFTFKCYYGSDMYKSFRSMICDSIGSSEKLLIETLDSTDNTITNVVMWGDSMTKAGNKTMGNMPDQLAELVANDVMIWNYGYSGNTIQAAGTRFNNHPEKHSDVSVIWLGTNNTTLSGEEMTSLIQSTFIDKLTTDKYIVVGLLTTNYSDEKNQAFATAFGDHFLNIREYFLENMWTISGLTATEQDNTDLSNNLIPTSFR